MGFPLPYLPVGPSVANSSRAAMLLGLVESSIQEELTRSSTEFRLSPSSYPRPENSSPPSLFHFLLYDSSIS